MKYVNMILTVLVIFYLLLTTFIVNHVFFGDALFYPAHNRWKLVWSDEFNGSALDITQWTAANQASGINHELQAYIDENAMVKDGKLVLACKSEKWTGPDNLHPGRAVTRYYTSALVSTQGKKVWTYGRFEIRAQLPKGRGLTPYIGFFSDESWPPEFGLGMPGGYPHQLFLINHWMNGSKHGQDLLAPKFSKDFSEGFHTFVIEWEPGVIRWMVDGVQTYQIKRQIPNKPLFLLLRDSVGGDYSVDPKCGLVNKGEERAVFPQYFQVDWVRVYQKR